MLFSLLVKGQSTFNSYYPSGDKSSAFYVQPANTSDYILCSYYIDNVTGQQGLDLNLLDVTGASLNHKTFLFGTIDFLSFGNNKPQCNISNSTMLLTGAGFTGTVSTVIFVSINKSTLDTNWSKTYKDGIYDYNLSHIIKVKPNEIWFMGARWNNSGYNSRPVIFKTDTIGNILSVKEFTSMINYETRQISYDTISHLLYIAGENYNPSPANPEYITCIDTTGFIIWNKYMAPSNTLFIYQVKRVGNEIIGSGSLQVSNILTPYGEHKLNLFKLNAANGNTIWNKTYGKAYMVNTLTDFFEQADGSIICTGSYSDKLIVASVNHDACLLKVNSLGDSLWMKTYGIYGQGVQEYMFDVSAAPDGGYIMCGAPNYANNYPAWAVKTDSLGVSPGMVITGMNEKDDLTDLKIYPTPANDVLNIKLNSENLKDDGYKAEIVNSLGQLISDEVILKNKTVQINTKAIPNGIYFLNITNNHSICISKRFVVIH